MTTTSSRPRTPPPEHTGRGLPVLDSRANPIADDALLADAEQLSGALSELIRVIQFRDRDRACCYDISVSQCYALKRVVSQVKRQRNWQAGLWNESQNRPAFNLSFYAVRKDGLYGSARMLGTPGSKTFAVCDADGARLESGSFLYQI